MTEIIGYAASVLVGFTLGLIGGGGSILSVPILVYLFGIEPVLATAYSLFVVGISSSVGALNYMRRGLLNYKTALIFVIPSFLTVFITRKFLIPKIPNQLFSLGTIDITTDLLFMICLVILMLGMSLITLNIAYHGNKKFMRAALLITPAAIMVFIVRQFIVPAIPHNIVEIGHFILTKNTAIMLLFAIVMVMASFSMIVGKQEGVEAKEPKGWAGWSVVIILLGILVGTITGLVGAGGGFLIIPALVIIAGLPIKTAVGTSLLIISINSLSGFLGDIHNGSIHWVFLLSFTSLSIVGIFAGSFVSKYINSRSLKRSFGWFILFMGIYIVIKEISQ